MGVKLYCITNRVNGKMYVGITTKTLGARLTAHRYNATAGDERKFYRAMCKHSTDKFDIELLFEYPSVDAAQVAEIATIAALDLCSVGYNSSPGGDLFNAGVPRSDEWKARIGAANRGKKHTAEARAKMSSWRTGRKQQPRSQEWRDNLAASHKGKIRSLETRKKMSDAAKRRWSSVAVQESI